MATWVEFAAAAPEMAERGAKRFGIGMTSRDDVLFEFYIGRAHWAVWEGLSTPDISRRAKSWREG